MLATVVENTNIYGSYYHMELAAKGIGKNARPGMFYMLKVGTGTDPLLRRPISLHSSRTADSVRFLYKDVGKGTRLLSMLKPDDAVDALGPLGNGFSMPKGMTKALLVAGGIGVAPLLGLAGRIQSERPGVEVVSFIGGRGADDLLAVREMSGLGIRAYLCTEDGSLARCGVVTDTLGEFIAKVGRRGTDGWVVYSCGPRGMMRAVHGLCAEHGLVHFASLESHMACGIGACMGCVTRTIIEGEEAYRLVCKDGPVFDAKTIIW